MHLFIRQLCPFGMACNALVVLVVLASNSTTLGGDIDQATKSSDSEQVNGKSNTGTASPQHYKVDRLWVDATINNKPARMVFDTGSSDLILFTTGAKRLGITCTDAPNSIQLQPGQIPTGYTEECDLRIGDSIGTTGAARTRFHVLDVPELLKEKADGILGWRPLKNNIFVIDANYGTVTCVPSVPTFTTNWTVLNLSTNSDTLWMELPKADGLLSTLFVDTGDYSGVHLFPDQWRVWKAAHTNQPFTLKAYYNPGDGFVVAHEAWAKKLSIGSLTMTDVPVTEASKSEIRLGSGTGRMSLGLAALKRLDVIVDGKRNIAYVHAKETAPPAYQHNRLGAVFVPANLQSDDLIAHVVEGSPAWKAGIRNGDILTSIGDLDVTKWRVDPAVLPLTRFFERPTGTRLDLRLKRGDARITATAVLEQILSPD